MSSPENRKAIEPVIQLSASGTKRIVKNLNSLAQFEPKLPAQNESKYPTFFTMIAKTHLLILDDFGLTHLAKQQQLDIMEIMENRYACHSSIIASQLPDASWFDVMEEATIADAILDGLVHTSHRIELNGESLRKNR